MSVMRQNIVQSPPQVDYVASAAAQTPPSPAQPRLPPSQPGCRGGHQMVMDNQSQTIYLFGGWDGRQDLGDFWSYHIPNAKWTLLSANTEQDGGPSPRKEKQIFYHYFL